jgi:AcrR family transcriptional regulator
VTAVAARRERLSAEMRRDQFVTATVAVLAEAGYQAATADRIASRAGVSKGLLWHYFTDLDDLFETTARQVLRMLSAAAAVNIDLGAPAPVVIRTAVHAAAALRITHGAERRAMREIVLNLRSPDGGPRFSQVDLDELYTAQEAIFRRGQVDGDFLPDLNPRLLAVTYQGAVDNMLEYLDAYPGTDSDTHADTLAAVLLGGIVQHRKGTQR